MAHLLLVDDDPNIVRITKLYLEKSGYGVDTSLNGREALALSETNRYDLILLDLMLPGMDGREICRRIRQSSSVPVIMLTARGEVHDRIEGLQLGADDYLVKPFDPNELVARVEAVLRRTRPSRDEARGDRYRFGNLEVDGQAASVKVQGEAVALTRKEYELLLLLVKHPNRVFPREDLVVRIWGEDYEGEDRVVDLNVQRLRSKLGGSAQGWQIATVWGMGYRFEGSAT